MQQMDEATILTAYKRYAKNYDRFFGKVFEHGRRRVVEKMNCRPGEKALDVGVGTGLALNLYPKHATVIGIDRSPDMLKMADKHVRAAGLTNVYLSLMDAQRLSFADNTFDKVTAMYVASVVPRPDWMMSEIKRVCKPNGDIFILNHFSNHHLLPRLIESLFIPFESLIGFRPYFPLDRFIDESGLDVVSTMPVNIFGYWTLIHAKNSNHRTAN